MYFFLFSNLVCVDSKPRYVRINRNLLSAEDAHAMLANEEWRKKEYPPFENYDDFLKAIKELEEDEYMLDMHVDDLLIFHPKKKHYWANHPYTEERQFLLQDKVCKYIFQCFWLTKQEFN